MNKNAWAVAWIVSVLVPPVLLLQGCEKNVPLSPEAEKELVIRYKIDGTKVVTDGTGAELEKIPLDKPADVVESLARRLGKDVLQVERTKDPLVVTFKQGLECRCECDIADDGVPTTGFCQCVPKGCSD